jgi:hypothetical protein
MLALRSNFNNDVSWRNVSAIEPERVLFDRERDDSPDKSPSSLGKELESELLGSARFCSPVKAPMEDDTAHASDCLPIIVRDDTTPPTPQVKPSHPQ